MDKKEIGKKIMALRTARGWAQYKLATESGISPSYIRVLEKGEKCPTVEFLDNICFAFGITLAQFFLDDEQIEVLSEQEKLLLDGFRKLDPKKQKAIIDLL